MEMRSKLTNSAGQVLDAVYREGDPLKGLEGKILYSVHAFCFSGNKLLIVYVEEKGRWSLPGGAIEKGETYEEAVVREVLEESNMKVLSQKLLGYQDLYEPERTIRQTRSVCLVEPQGEFTGDPDGEITETKLISPAEYKKYFNWGEIGDHLMQKALKERGKLAGNSK